ncbi:MAG: hypothetical protein AAGL92_10815, partial [Pseudomonadota bacterium]
PDQTLAQIIQESLPLSLLPLRVLDKLGIDASTSFANYRHHGFSGGEKSKVASANRRPTERIKTSGRRV